MKLCTDWVIDLFENLLQSPWSDRVAIRHKQINFLSRWNQSLEPGRFVLGRSRHYGLY
ncbi:MAG: hypothetical protein VKJ24_01575 [Synechococcales bacterium]|nr:hypothetical protein [Synechococcales bacterium]